MRKECKLEIHHSRLTDPAHRHRVAITTITVHAGLRTILLVKNDAAVKWNLEGKERERKVRKVRSYAAAGAEWSLSLCASDS